jgi:hypothetical protein
MADPHPDDGAAHLVDQPAQVTEHIKATRVEDPGRQIC